MDQPAKSNQNRSKIIFLSVILIVGAGLLGWYLGRSNTKSRSSVTNSTTSNTSANSTANVDVNSLISYTLPDGWAKKSCSNAANKVFVVPNGASFDCNANRFNQFECILI